MKTDDGWESLVFFQNKRKQPEVLSTNCTNRSAVIRGRSVSDNPKVEGDGRKTIHKKNLRLNFRLHAEGGYE
eukprot:755453-Amphidinium_carterae.1